MSGEEAPAVVVDVGSYETRAGYAGEEEPRCRFRSVVEGDLVGDQVKHKAARHHARLRMNSAVNTEMVGKLLKYALREELRVEETPAPPLMLAECGMGTKSPRERLVQLAFEELRVPAFHMAQQGALALYASGRTTGVVVDVGYAVTHVLGVYEGYVMPHSFVRVDIGGHDITLMLQEEMGISEDIARDAKEQCCMTDNADYVLPDGEVLRLSPRLMRAPNALFEPHLVGSETPGLANATFHNIMKGDIDIRHELYGNICLVGGGSCSPGTGERLQRDVSQLAPAVHTVNVAAEKNRRDQVWIGGSVLASLSSMQPMWITKQEYEESGAAVVHKKCF